MLANEKETSKSIKAKRKKAPKVRLPKDTLGIRKPFHFINLPNGDVRHSYPKLFAACINGSDPTSLKSFMSLYFAPKCDLIYHYDGDVNADGPIYNKMEGNSTIFAFFDSIFGLYPDYFMTVWDTSAQAHPTTKCGFIKCSYKVTYTKVYEGAVIKNLPLMDVQSDMSSRDSGNGSSCNKSHQTTTEITSSSVSSATISTSNDDKIHLLDKEDLLCGELFDMLFSDEQLETDLCHYDDNTLPAAEKSSGFTLTELVDPETIFSNQRKLLKTLTVVTDGIFVLHLDNNAKITKLIYFYKTHELEQGITA